MDFLRVIKIHWTPSFRGEVKLSATSHPIFGVFGVSSDNIIPPWFSILISFWG
jgi:hypothetical protein